MDDQRDQLAEQVEDLETPAAEAEDVKGGFIFGVERLFGQDAGAQKVSPTGLRGRGDGMETQHNETLVRI